MAVPHHHLPRDADLRLVVSDMDGTLLDDAGHLPDEFWPLLDVMRERGIVFAPASGRQRATLETLFERALDGMSLIAENGTYVVRDGAEVSSAVLPPSLWQSVVAATRAARADGLDLGVVVCGKRAAYLERTDDAFLTACSPYYVTMQLVADQLAVDDEIIKMAVYDFDDAEVSVARFAEFAADHQVVVSGRNWIDIMAAGINKGAAVRALQADLGVTRAQTVAFGDFFNDAEMLDEADWSFATANAHPAIRERARYGASSNADHGVLRVLEHLLGL
ncbi:Cof-type HAD-IIB family hydrolase [Propioniciclava soli]|uniref:Cof-type HAD-IIB family hydrolase n=1 Tax=Propioniciclava soli TaxID=2775081 RepID=A0ABZ3C5P1_9ACTN